MRAIYWRHVQTEFKRQMMRHLPEFEPARVRLSRKERQKATLDPGAQFFRRQVNERLHCFVSVSPDTRHERFWLAAGWSTLARVPWDAPRTSATEERKEFELAECIVDFERLFYLKYAVGHGAGWDLEAVSVEFGDPGYLEALLEESLAPPSDEQAPERARETVTLAIEAIKDVVVPYLEERIEWEDQAVRRVRAKEWKRFTQARESFAVRLFRWARDQAQREFEDGYPRVRAITDVSARKFLDHMGSLPRKDQARLAEALVKRGFPTALRLTGESVTTEETSLIERYVHAPLSAPLLDAEIEDGRGAADARIGARARREAVWAQVKAELRPRLGGEGKAGPRPEQWQWDTPVEAWTVRTNVFVWGAVRLIYSQSVGLLGPPPRYLCTNMALLAWLGIANTTSWSLSSEREVQEAVGLLGRLCAEFFSAASEALTGLSPDGVGVP